MSTHGFDQGTVEINISELSELHARLAMDKVVIEALRWYADPKNYDLNWAGNSEVQLNKGERARDALKGGKE